MRTNLKSKRIQAVIVLAIAALLVMTGTFAWYSFNQRRVNVFNITSVPNVNLHDDFAGGPEKDVYVENSGVQPALVRVRLTELLNQNEVLLPNGAVDDETAANWHVHTPSEVCEVCDFAAHEYFKWTMNGHKFYMSAPDSAKGSKIDDTTYTEPKDVGDLDAIIDYANLLRAAFAGDSLLLSYIDEYLGGDTTHAAELQTAIKAISEENTVSGVRQYNGQPDDELVRKLNEVRLTLIPMQIITMQDWIDGTTYFEPYKTGDFWVVDADGWCYWANALKQGEATGQLLSSIDNIKTATGELIYKINVVLNATTFANTELNEFFLTAQANGGIGEEGMRLMFIASGDYVVGEDGELYKNDGGAYRQVLVNEGSYVNHTLGDVIYAGADGLIGTVDDTLVSPEDTERRYFHHIGNGVYIEVADETGTQPKYEPLTYYFSSEIFAEEPFVINNLDGHSIDAKVEAIFSFSLYIGEQFGVLDDKETGFSAILKGQEMQDAKTDGKIQSIFTMIELYELDEQLYINLTEHYANLYLGGTGANGEFGGTYAGELAEIDELDGKMKPAVVPNRPDGDGTQEEPFLIKSRTEMNWLTRELMHGNTLEGKYLEVVKDFSMGDSDFLPIGSAANQFKGIFDGADFTISDLKIISTGNYVGLFGYVGADGVVENLTLENMNVNGHAFTGGLAGWSDGTIENCSVSGAVHGMSNSIGGIVGRNAGTISDCDYTGDVTGDANNNGGIVGYNNGTVQGCTNYGTVTGTAANPGEGSGAGVGGVVGFNPGGFVTDCINNGTIKGSNNNVGGIVGSSNAGTVSDCTNTGNVTGEGINVGGVVGLVNIGDTVNASTNSGTVKGSGINVGGVSGNNSGGTVQDCTNSGAVEGSNGSTGGVAGINSGSVTSCRNSGTVYCTSGNGAGGIVGGNGVGGTITYCGNTGNVQSAASYVGGVSGSNAGKILRCYSKASVFGLGAVGGVAGSLNAADTPTIKYCYAWGDVTGSASGNELGVGGIVGVVGSGATSAVISDVYHAGGKIICSGTNRTGGILGHPRGSLSKAYALATSITGDNKGPVAGGNFTMTNCYHTLAAAGFTNTGATQRAKPANLNGWSTVIPDFGNATIWRWDSTNQLPVLVGVTP